MARNALILALLLLFASTALAWNWETHRWIGGKLCDDMACGDCREYMINGSIAPDKDFKDTVNHHAYNTSWACPASADGSWECPTTDDFVALNKADEWLVKAETATGCERFYDIAVASHYYTDSFVFWHRVQKEDYDHCHSLFESAVGRKIGQDFNVSYCGSPAVTDEDITAMVAKFETIIDVVPKPVQPQTAPITGDVTLQFVKDNWIILLPLAGAIIMLILLLKPKKLNLHKLVRKKK